jgi:hypothetical protein
LLETPQIYREQVLTGAVVINGEPVTSQEKDAQFQFRRTIVQAVVTRDDTFKDKSISVDLEITMPETEGIKEAPQAITAKVASKKAIQERWLFSDIRVGRAVQVNRH